MAIDHYMTIIIVSLVLGFLTGIAFRVLCLPIFMKKFSDITASDRSPYRLAVWGVGAFFLGAAASFQIARLLNFFQK